MSKIKRIRRTPVWIPVIIMLLSILPLTAMAETTPADAGNEIIAFEALSEQIKNQKAALGTASPDLGLPESLRATVLSTTVDSGDSDTSSEGEETDPQEIIVSVPVTWTSESSYDGNTAGSYTFTAEAQGYSVASGVKIPQITVTVQEEVSPQAGGEITAFEPLDSEITQQAVPVGTLLSELTLPKTLTVTIDKETASVPITWTSEPEYSPGSEDEEPGSYLFTPQVGEEYTLAEGVSAPQVSVDTIIANVSRGLMSVLTDWDQVQGAIDDATGDTIDLSGLTTPDNGKIYTFEVGNNKTLTLKGGDTMPTEPIENVAFVFKGNNNITIENLNIKSAHNHDSKAEAEGGEGYSPLHFTGTENTLTLEGENRITSGQTYDTSNYGAAVGVPVSAGLTIAGSGTVTATGGSFGAGIGGGYQGAGGNNITIEGGTVTATGGCYGAGIGGGDYGAGGSITIKGGTVTATGGIGGAGIGGGDYGAGGSITIKGGTVTATGGGGGAGIGGGSNGLGGTVKITGGTLKATGGTYAEDIGHGRESISSLDSGSLTNDGSTSVYLNILTRSNLKSTSITSASYGTDSTSYGTTDVQTDENGMLYFYLPASDNTELVQLKAIEETYYANYPRTNTHDTVKSLRKLGEPLTSWDDVQFELDSAAANAVIDLSGFTTPDDGKIYTFEVGNNKTLTLKGGDTMPTEPIENVAFVFGEKNKITIENLNIKSANDHKDSTGSSKEGYSPLHFTGTGNTLTLVGENKITSGQTSYTSQYGAAVGVPVSAKLTIAGSGTVTATGGSYGAGIGGGFNDAGDNITIEGGTVTATGGYNGAGIGGGGYKGAGGNITIEGGTVTATGGGAGAGIGGGDQGAGGNITIEGGTVTATGGIGGAGIGGGYEGAGGSIIIKGGTVTATGGYFGAGIGGGCDGAGGTVKITGGSVKAMDGTDGDGGSGEDIGHGGEYNSSSLSSGSLSDGSTPVYLNILSRNDLKNTSIASASYGTANTDNTLYETKDVQADEDGMLYFYLPASNNPELVQVKAEDKAYYTNYQRTDTHGTVKSLRKLGEPLTSWDDVQFELDNAAENAVIDLSGLTTPEGGKIYTFKVGDNTTLTLKGGDTIPINPIENVAFVSGKNNNITIENLNIKSAHNHDSKAEAEGGEGYSPLHFTGTGNTLTLVGENKITSGQTNDTLEYGAAVGVPESAGLTIAGLGTVTATGGSYGAGIGGGLGGEGGSITIEGGTVTATGGSGGAGIGGGYNSDGGSITIKGGTVTATGGSCGAGIGGGDYDAGGIIIIEGGTVTATGGNLGAGIGGGDYGAGGSITIEGGTVTATGGTYGAGIGGGYNGAGGNITIEGGTVTATGGYDGAGIGGGHKGDGGTVEITGGSVKAKGGTDAEDIGHGGEYTSGSLDSGSLTNGSNDSSTSVYLNILTRSNLKNTSIASASYGTASTSYGTKDVQTDEDGKLYFYLPASTEEELINVTAGTTTYAADYKRLANHDNTASLCLGSLRNAAITIIGTPTYNGSDLTPNVTVTLGGLALKKNVDYTVSYEGNCKDAETTDAKVIVTGKGDYTGKAKIDFFISPKALTNAMLLSIEAVTYNKSAQKPPVIVMDGDDTLVLDTDYTVEYSSNTNAGTAKVTVTGNGNYSGNAEKEFTILSKALNDTMLSLIGEVTYNNSAQKPTVTVMDGDYTLVLDTDYTVGYSNNTNAGTAIVAVTGKGNYAGMVSGSFPIKKADAPEIHYPTAGALTYGQKLSESVLTEDTCEYGSFSWENGSTVPNVGDDTYTMKFTPHNDTVKNYETIANLTEPVSVLVTQATPVITVAAAVSGSTGSRTATLTAVILRVGSGETPTGTVKFVDSTSGSDIGIADADAVPIIGGKATFEWTGRADQVYKVNAIYSGNTNYKGADSAVYTFDTRKQNQEAPAIRMSYQYTAGSFTVTIVKQTGCEYSFDGTNWSQTKNTKADCAPGSTVTGYIRKFETDTHNASAATYSILVLPPVVSSVTVSGTGGASAITTNRGTLQMLAQVDPLGATQAVTWSVSGSGASIHQAGLLTASANGTVTVRATATDGTGIYGEIAIAISGQYRKSEDSGDLGSGSGSGSGSSSGSGQGTPAAPSIEQPNIPTRSESNVTARISRGRAVVLLTEKIITDAYEKALAEALQNGGLQNGITLVLNVNTGSKTRNSVTFNLPKAVQELLISKGIVNIVIVVENPDITISMDLETIKEINRQAGTDVNITATRVSSSKLTGDAKAAIGTRPVFDLKVTSGSGKSIQSFGAGRVSVTIPYSLGANEKAGNIQAAYVDANGRVQWLVNSAYDSINNVLLFSTGHFSVYGVGCQKDVAGLTDVEGHWAKDDIAFALNRGLLSGTLQTAFGPNMAMTEGMFVTAFGRLANADVSAYQKNSFINAKNDDCYTDYIEWASNNGIINSFGEDQSVLDQTVTREQMAVMMSSYAKTIGYSLPKVHAENIFADNDSISAYAKEAVKQLQMAGVISDKSGNLFDPQGMVTRAEASAMLRRFVELTISSDTAQGWTKNDSGEWMYYENGKIVTDETLKVPQQ